MAHAASVTRPAIDHRYLRASELRGLGRLFFASRRVVEGQYAGRHASSQRGHSVEFNDYRQYTPGDELGDIDWKVYGRSDRLYIKLFEHQSDMTVNMLIDASASMAYRGFEEDGGRQPWQRRAELPASKYDHACRMAAAIAFLTVRQQDKVSFGLAREGLADFLRPLGTFAHLFAILDHMEQAAISGQAKLAEAIAATARRTSRKGLFVLFSDLLEDQEEILKALSLFTHRGNEVIVFHVLHAHELHLPDLAEAVMIDSESGRRVRLNVDDVRPAYEKRLRRMLDGWSTAMRNRGIDYQLVSTAAPFQKALSQYLFTRASMM